jgi:hypothetical protein
MQALDSFPDYDDKQGLIEALTLLAGLGFSDSSYKNDSCPQVSGGDYQIWLDYANPELRESGASSRFSIQWFNNETDEFETVANYDSWLGLLIGINELA